MAAETCAILTILKCTACVGGGILVTALVGYACYRAYKYFQTEKPHKTGNEDGQNTFVLTVDDIGKGKPNESSNSTVRRRCVFNGVRQENLELKKQPADIAERDNNKVNEKRENEKRGNENRGGCDSHDKVESWFKVNQVIAGDQTQMINQNSPAPSVVDSVSVDSDESVRSFGSSDSVNVPTPTIDIHIIRTWEEMSYELRAQQCCFVCPTHVETVTNECNHPYLCLKCIEKANRLCPKVKKCPLCHQSIQGYTKIYP